MFFLREWISDPLRVAAITPSSQRLARLITSEIDANAAPVIELGPGTGVFTRALIANGIDERDLALVELGARFATELKRSFPSARVLHASAEILSQRTLFGEQGAGAIVSGLGLLSMPKHIVEQILKGALDNLRPEGGIYQFTYGWRCPVPDALLSKFNLKAARLGTVCANLPPASVYKLTRCRKTATSGSANS
ncbi:class I SAM-dependent methyltransferase [Roseibium sp. SCP14]|uniref:class I SAM-dependent methyltransferase n=1 Tax=Roseibium sp. SCP14 TaxID=3141375 RepID=UPI0033395EEE